MDPLSLLWLFLIFVSLQPVLQRCLLAQRQRRLESISRKRGAKVVW
jgi:hypothetical protein